MRILDSQDLEKWQLLRGEKVITIAYICSMITATPMSIRSRFIISKPPERDFYSLFSMNRLLQYSLECNTISFNHFTSPGGRDESRPWIYILDEKPEVGQDIPEDSMHA